jgi:flagellar motor protein MotB
MAKDRAPAPEENTPVPAWVVSFSDMVTLLLAFFVLLQAFAHVQDPELFYVGQGSFRRAISGLGIPGWLLGKEDKVEREYIRVKHPTESDPDDPSRRQILNPDDDRIRQIFAQLARDAQSKTEDASLQRYPLAAPDLRFAPGSAAMSDDARARVRQFARSLKNLPETSIRIYVVGVATDGASVQENWMLSARRAELVGDALREALREGDHTSRWQVHSLGAGEGNAWCREKLGLSVNGPAGFNAVGLAVVGNG